MGVISALRGLVEGFKKKAVDRAKDLKDVASDGEFKLLDTVVVAIIKFIVRIAPWL